MPAVPTTTTTAASDSNGDQRDQKRQIECDHGTLLFLHVDLALNGRNIGTRLDIAVDTRLVGSSQ